MTPADGAGTHPRAGQGPGPPWEWEKGVPGNGALECHATECADREGVHTNGLLYACVPPYATAARRQKRELIAHLLFTYKSSSAMVAK